MSSRDRYRVRAVGSRMMRRALPWAILMLAWVSGDRAPGVALAQPEARSGARAASATSPSVDWTRGLIVALGQAGANIRAPSVDIARVEAERVARSDARTRLADAARQLLDTAPGRGDGAVDRALEMAMDHAIELDLRYASDGSVVARMGLPIESLRVAVQGVPVHVPVPAETPVHDAVIVDARGVLDTPVLGPGLVLPSKEEPGEGEAADTLVLVGPTVYHIYMEEALADPRAGRSALIVRARGLVGSATPEDGAAATSGVGLRLDGAKGATRIRRRRPGRKAASPEEPASIELLAPSIRSGALIIVVTGEKGT